MTMPIALTIAGSDSSGGAGIQADLKTFAALGVYGASAITALTAQNTRALPASMPCRPILRAQIDAVFADLDVGAVKIGMVAQLASDRGDRGGAEALVAETFVLDPVMVATSGDRLLAQDAVEALRTKPHSARQRHHAEPARSGRAVERAGRFRRGRDRGTGQKAARARLSRGADQGRARAGQREHRLSSAPTATLALPAPRMATENTHGTGCSLSSAIAAELAKGAELETAVRNAKAFVSAAIAAADRFTVGHGHGPIHHFYRFY